jgi:S-adenosylmethionine-diacylgycerolhomoserine-N-methlytransferase
MTASAHQALMDRIYRHQRHFYDLTRRPYLFGRDTLIKGLDARPGDRILEIGCGTARNLIKIARAYPGTQLWGIDASAEMLRTATQSVDRAHLSGRIALRHGLAEDASTLFARENLRLDRIVFSYSLSMIADWRGALNTAQGLLSGRGQIHIVDFGVLTGVLPPAAKLLRAWLRLFHVKPRAELLHQAEVAARYRTDCRLNLLFGRYAFVFSASSAVVGKIIE